MDWSDVRVFLAIARTSTLGGAARSLGLSHPTIGRRLQALESALGQKLFQRTVDGFVLTEEGTSVLALAEQIEDAALAMERRLAGQTRGLEGTLRISASDWFGSWMLPRVVSEYSRRHAAVTIELLTASRIYSLSHREADLAFRVVPFNEPDVVQRHLLTVQFGVYTARGLPVSIDGDGAGLKLIEDVPSSSVREEGWLKRRFPKGDVALRSNNRTVQAQMCAEGVGLAVLPRSIGDRMASLTCVDLADAPPQRDLWMGYHRDLRTLQRLRSFVDVAVELLTGEDGMS